MKARHNIFLLTLNFRKINPIQLHSCVAKECPFVYPASLTVHVATCALYKYSYLLTCNGKPVGGYAMQMSGGEAVCPAAARMSNLSATYSPLVPGGWLHSRCLRRCWIADVIRLYHRLTFSVLCRFGDGSQVTLVVRYTMQIINVPTPITQMSFLMQSYARIFDWEIDNFIFKSRCTDTSELLSIDVLPNAF